MHMRTTLNIDDKLIAEASRLTGVTEKTSLVRMGLEALVRREAAKRLAAMGGADTRASAAPRKRRWNRRDRRESLAKGSAGSTPISCCPAS